MSDKNLNALDGDAMLQEVLNEKIDTQRKAYKRAIKNAVVRNENAQEASAKSAGRAEKNQKKLDDLVNGGLEGYLTIPEDVVEDVVEEEEEGGGTSMILASKRTYRSSRPSKLSSRWRN